MKSKSAYFVLAVLTIVTAFGASKADAYTMKSFTADMESVTAKHTVNSKMYFKTDKQRMETNEKGQESIVIIRQDKKVMWMVMPQQKMYMEMSLKSGKKDAFQMRNEKDAKVEKEPLGSETVDGHPTKKYHETYYYNGKKEGSGFVWEATDLDNFPIKYQNEEKNATTTFKNIKLGDPADSLFETPAGYQKMDMGGMMGGAMGGPGAHKRKH